MVIWLRPLDNLFKQLEVTMLRDIDYAAIAVKKAIVDKFGQSNDLETLDVVAGKQTIAMAMVERIAEASRDSLLAGVRNAGSYADPGKSGRLHKL